MKIKKITIRGGVGKDGEREKVQEFELETNEKGARNFLALIGLELESGEEGTLKQNLEEEGPDTVKIMTVHAAKGLEFKYVFIVNLVDKKFPSVSQSEPIKLPEKLIKEITAEGDIHLQEERRLFYVGMTRAKEGVYFTSADDYGGNRKKKLSRFLIELAEAGLKLSERARTEKEKSIIEEKTKLSDKKKDLILENFLPATFSFSQIRAFESCPYQYRFAYILKVPTKGNPQFSFGKTIHSTMQKFFQLVNLRKMSQQKNLFGDEAESGSPTGEELLKIYEMSFIDDWYPDRKTKEQYFEKGKKALKEFYEKHKDNLPEVKFLEYPFNLKIKNDVVYAFFGVIDRVDKTKEGIRIVDYKTGRVKNKLEPEDKEQLLIYQLAAQEVMKEKVKELIFYYIEENKEMAFLGTDKELDKLKKKIIDIIEEIKKGSFPPKPGNICQWCDFNSICEFRAG
ncbi:ATP-dependent helicase [Candidatus Falkowbacteria bacterium]|nr:ATP-dependent helicase [Candidatus Falkowbacteria bacterium]